MSNGIRLIDTLSRCLIPHANMNRPEFELPSKSWTPPWGQFSFSKAHRDNLGHTSLSATSLYAHADFLERYQEVETFLSSLGF
jgi:hypothetical protein